MLTISDLEAISAARLQDVHVLKAAFERFRSFKVHDLEVLLKLSGLESVIKDKQLAEWGVVKAWQPEVRYRQVGFADEIATTAMLDAVLSLMREL